MSYYKRHASQERILSHYVPAHPEEFLHFVEEQLHARTYYPYSWHRPQNNDWDRRTDFIYHIADFQILLQHMHTSPVRIKPGSALFDYALTRWYNHWSAQAVEHIFAVSPRVSAIHTQHQRTADFSIDNIALDHKTTVFPKGYARTISYALNNKRHLIEWLYTHQSTGQRYQYNNRVFVVLYDNAGEHWKLKSKVSWLRDIIEGYMEYFDPCQLEPFTFAIDNHILADIMWGIH